jgi:hypothetical protein
VIDPLLAELASRVDVRVLVWAGSPLPLLHPDRKDVDGVRHALTFRTRVQFVADAKERPHLSRRTRRLMGPVTGLLVDG